MNLSIQDGRAELWQWDTGVRLVMDEACEAVNLSEDTFGVTVDVTAAEDGKTWVAAVPDEMLQKPGDLICYAVQFTATGTITAAYRSFRVNRRPKPAGYVATPSEARTWQKLDEKKIDAPQVAQVGEVLTVEEVDEDGKPTKWKTAPGIRGEKGDTGPAGPQGETGPAGPKGADGKDGAGMDVTGAKIGQIAKITAVDAAGKPTEWEPVDMPSGGGSGETPWRILRDIMITETVSEQTQNVTYYTNNNGEVKACEFSTDEDDAAFSVSEIVVVGILENLETTGTGCGIGVYNGTYLGNQEITYIREGLVTGKKQTLYIHAYNLFGKYTMTDFYSFQYLQKTGFQGSWNNLSNTSAFNDTSKMLDAWKPRASPPWTKLAIGTGGQGISGRIIFFAR